MFFLVAGCADLLVGDEVVPAHEGDLVVVPQRVPHAFAAPPGASADLLIVLAPGVDRFDYFRLLERVARGDAGAEQLAAAQQRFDTWFVDSPTWDRARALTGREQGGTR